MPRLRFCWRYTWPWRGGRAGTFVGSPARCRTMLIDGIDLTVISTSMTINATASILLALYVAVARRQGRDIRRLSGTVQNDVLKEYIARGTYIYPPQQAMRIITDVFAWSNENVPEWNTI